MVSELVNVQRVLSEFNKYLSSLHFMMSIIMIPQTTRSRTKFQACWTGISTQIHMFTIKEGLIEFFGPLSFLFSTLDFPLIQVSF